MLGTVRTEIRNCEEIVILDDYYFSIILQFINLILIFVLFLQTETSSAGKQLVRDNMDVQ